MNRRAWVQGARYLDQVRYYLPGNYEVVGFDIRRGVAIEGVDVEGRTLDGYVFPRLEDQGRMTVTEHHGLPDAEFL